MTAQSPTPTVGAPLSLHADLLAVLKQTITVLPSGYDFRGENTYIDLFGASLAQQTRGRLGRLALDWLLTVESCHEVSPSAILVPKSGNVLLADGVARESVDPRLHLLVGKDPRDKSAITEEDEDGRPSPVNFEGLREFSTFVRGLTHPKQRVIAFDDSCRNGGTLRHTINRLNGLVAAEPETYPFELVSDVLVLFRRESQPEQDDLADDLHLHALLAFDNAAIQRLARLNILEDGGAYETLADELLDDAPAGVQWLKHSREERRRWHSEDKGKTDDEDDSE